MSVAQVRNAALKGVRKQVWNRLTGSLLATSEVNIALDALYQYPLTDEAERILRRTLRNGSIDALAETLIRLHQEQRLVVDDPGDDSLRIVCTMGIQA